MAILFHFAIILVLATLVNAKIIHANINNNTFTVGDDGTTFLLNGHPHRILSAGFHYFRCPAAEWEDRLMTIKASGSINTIQTYVAWNFHCPDRENECNFEGDRDLVAFLELCQRHGFHILLRPGPYICAEWEFGGFPAWIVAKNQSIKLRTSDPQYLSYVTEWYKVLLPKLQPYMFVNGGPILMVQIENEYGSYALISPDTAYLTYLCDLTSSLVGKNVLLYSTDPNGSIDRSSISGVFQAIDFLYWGQTNTNASWWWEQQKAAQKNSMPGPPMNDEFYPGWLSQWGDAWVYSHTVDYVNMMVKDMMITSSRTSNMNFYMFFGGTNFGFWNGGVVTTSYDYGAPVNESGHAINKFHSLKQKIFPFITDLNVPLPVPPLPNIPVPTYYGTVTFDGPDSIIPLNTAATYQHITEKEVSLQAPITMEALGQSYGYTKYVFDIAYSTGNPLSSIAVLAQDYALVYLGEIYIGHLLTVDGVGNLTINVPADVAAQFPQTLTIVVENTGRPNTFLSIQEIWKGIRYPVTFTYANGQTNKSGQVSVAALPMKYELIETLYSNFDFISHRNARDKVGDSPNTAGYFARGTLQIDNVVGGTLLDMRSFGKGFVFVNGRNVGRYFSVLGPQYSLFVPKSFLKTGINTIVVFEQAQVFATSPSVPPITFSNVNFNIKKDTDI